MKFLVTGSAGLVGSKVVKDLIKQNHTVFSCYHDETPDYGIATNLDLTNLNGIKTITSQISPDVIIHLAAMTKVDLCETEQDLADAILFARDNPDISNQIAAEGHKHYMNTSSMDVISKKFASYIKDLV